MWRIALVAGLALAGCFSASETVCSDGTVCPDKKVCAPAGGACVDQEQIDACQGVADGGGCQLATIGHGVCRGGVCVAVGGCGDCVVEDGEVCDDCNTTSGDGCRADCQKIEMCGDGIVDDGEACDDGNQDPSDGCDACKLTEWLATPSTAGNSQPLAIQLAAPGALAVDRNGNVFIADTSHERVLRLDGHTGAIVTVAGNGVRSTSFQAEGDGGLATAAELGDVSGLAVDGLGNLFIAEHPDRIRRVDATTGIITTYAGNGQFDGPINGGFGDGGPATLAKIRGDDVAVDGLGNVYIIEQQAHLIRVVDPSGIIHTFAGAGTSTADGVPAASLQLDQPVAIATDTQNNVYFIDSDRVRKVDGGTGLVSTLAGTGAYGDDGDMGPAIGATLASPIRIAVDLNRNVYLLEHDRVREISATTGNIDIVAGGMAGTSGDGGPALAAALGTPQGLAVDPGSNLWISQWDNNSVREVHRATGIIDRQVGIGTAPLFGPAELTSQTLGIAQDVAVDAQDRVYVAMSGITMRFDASGPTLVANLSGGLAFDTAGKLYIADRYGGRVSRVDGGGNVTTIAGNGTFGFSGDGGAATAAALNYPSAVAVDANGNVYIADQNNQRIRKVDTNGVISTIAGNGSIGDGGDGSATALPLNYPAGLVVDGAGNVYFADTYNHRVRKVGTNGLMVTVAGTGTDGSGGDGGAATSAELSSPQDVFFDPSGRLCIVDQGDANVRRIDANGVISTIAGNGFGWFGDHGPATAAGLGVVTSGVSTSQGTMFLINQEVGDIDGRLRTINASGIISTVVGKVEPPGMGPLANAQLIDPGALAVTPAGLLVAGGTSGTVQDVGSSTIEAVIGRYVQDAPTGMLARYRDKSFPNIGGLTFDAAANIVYVSAGNEIDAVTLVDPSNPDTWTFRKLAGDAIAGYGDGAAPLFSAPAGLALDAATHALYVADTGNHVVRVVNTQTGSAVTIAGTPRTRGFAGDGGDARLGLLNAPSAVAVQGANVYIADTGNNRIRRIAGGMISSVLGDGVAGSSGEGSPASQFSVDQPRGLACDALGNLFVTSRNTVRLLAADATGTVDGQGSVETIYGRIPRTTFPESVTRCLNGVTVIDDKTVRISDSCTGMLIDLVRQVKP